MPILLTKNYNLVESGTRWYKRHKSYFRNLLLLPRVMKLHGEDTFGQIINQKVLDLYNTRYSKK